MPKFHFNIHDDDGLIPDEEGLELPDLEAARFEATESAREMIADAVRMHKELDGRRIEIADGSGTVIESFKVRDVLN